MDSCELFSKWQKRARGCTVSKRAAAVHVIQFHARGPVTFHAIGCGFSIQGDFMVGFCWL